jgi:hypothetical protein
MRMFNDNDYMQKLREQKKILNSPIGKKFMNGLWEILVDSKDHDRSCVYFSHMVKGSCDCNSSLEYEEVGELFADVLLENGKMEEKREEGQSGLSRKKD